MPASVCSRTAGIYSDSHSPATIRLCSLLPENHTQSRNRTQPSPDLSLTAFGLIAQISLFFLLARNPSHHSVLRGLFDVIDNYSLHWPLAGFHLQPKLLLDCALWRGVLFRWGLFVLGTALRCTSASSPPVYVPHGPPQSSAPGLFHAAGADP